MDTKELGKRLAKLNAIANKEIAKSYLSDSPEFEAATGLEERKLQSDLEYSEAELIIEWSTAHSCFIIRAE